MKFPLWRYLRQFLNKNQTAIINPAKYRQIYEVGHLENCLNNNFLEHCWNCDYHKFIEQNWYFVDRHYLEEGNNAYKDLCEYCWRLNYYYFQHQRRNCFDRENFDNFA